MSPKVREIITTLFIVCLTIFVSLTVAIIVNGTLLEPVKVVDLAYWGGVTFESLAKGEVWRIASAQFVHVKLPHMVLNVVMLIFVGALVERRTTPLFVICVWLLGGGISTLISPVFVDPPYNVGTGASQAVLAMAGASLPLIQTKNIDPPFTRAEVICVVITILIPFSIDIIVAGYPKIGHILGLLFGMMLGYFWKWNANSLKT